MNFAIIGAIVSLVSTLLPIATQVAQMWKSSAGFPAIAKVILASPAAADLAAVGAALFPAADKAIQSVLAAIHLGVPEATTWVQTGLNAAQKLGFISFGAPLVVDGKFGPRTFAAVVVLQAKLKLPATGAVADAEYAALNLLVTGKIP